MLSRLKVEYGLVIVDPLDRDLKRLASPIYLKAIRHADEIVSAIRKRSEELVADGYEAQVLVDEHYFPLFWHSDDGVRHSLRGKAKGIIATKDKAHEFSTRELEAIASTEPWRFSPGVLLRPVVQDYLLPTVCYF